MKPTNELKTGMVVQLNPDIVGNKAFAGCYMTISEPKGFGAVGYVQGLGTRECMGDIFFYRANFEEMELVGKAVWVDEESEVSDENGLLD